MAPKYVYVVWTALQYEEDRILSIHASKKGAKSACDKAKEEHENNPYGWERDRRFGVDKYYLRK